MVANLGQAELSWVALLESTKVPNFVRICQPPLCDISCLKAFPCTVCLLG